MPSFLIVKSSAIGDVIQTFPVLEYLRKKFPDAKIDWLVEKSCRDLLLAHPLLNKVHTIDTKLWRNTLHKVETWQQIIAMKRGLASQHYDALFDVQGNSKSGLFTLLAKAKDKVGFGFHTVHERPNYFVTNIHFEVPREQCVRARYVKLVQNYFEDKEPFVYSPVALRITKEEESRLGMILEDTRLGRPKIMVAFGSKWRNKQLPIPTLKAFLSHIAQEIKASFVFIYGSEEERKSAVELQEAFAKTSVTVGKLSLPLWQALMSKMDAVIAMDSAALHLCATTATPSFSVFGPSLGSIFCPKGSHHFHQGSCPYKKEFLKQCPILRTCETGSCIRDLAHEELMITFKKFWQKEGLLAARN